MLAVLDKNDKKRPLFQSVHDLGTVGNRLAVRFKYHIGHNRSERCGQLVYVDILCLLRNLRKHNTFDLEYFSITKRTAESAARFDFVPKRNFLSYDNAIMKYRLYQ